MADQTALHAILQSRVEALEKERLILQREYEYQVFQNSSGSVMCPSTSNNGLLAQLWQQAGKSFAKYRDILPQQEQDRAKKVEELVQSLIRLTPTAEQQIQLAQIQKDEKLRLAEIAKEEKIRIEELSREKHELNINEKVRLAEIANDQHKEHIKLEKEEKVRLAEIAVDEKVKLAQTERDGKSRLAEIAESEKVRLAQTERDGKTRLMELEKDMLDIQKDEKCKLKELYVDESKRHRELRWEELRRIAELQQEVIPNLVALETEVRRANAKKDETTAILQCLERLADNSNDNASVTTTAATLLSTRVTNEDDAVLAPTEQTEILGRVDRTLNLIREMRVVFDRACTAVSDADKAKAEDDG